MNSLRPCLMGTGIEDMGNQKIGVHFRFPAGNPFYRVGNWPISASSISNFRQERSSAENKESISPPIVATGNLDRLEQGRLFPAISRTTSSFGEPAKEYKQRHRRRGKRRNGRAAARYGTVP